MGAAAKSNADEINEIIPIHQVSGPVLQDISMEQSQFGRADSLRYAILNLVVDGSYDTAIRELSLYADSKEEYPDFRYRSERFIDYATDLVNAIRTKRNFPGHNMLRQAKRHELNERVHEHFADLKQCLISIENIEIELRVQDLRSTVWVLQTICACLVVLFIAGLIIDIYNFNLLMSLYHVMDHFYNWVTDVIVAL